MSETRHNCDGKIGEHLRYVEDPASTWNDGRPSWMLHCGDYVRLPIRFCPVCGERLEKLDA